MTTDAPGPAVPPEGSGGTVPPAPAASRPLPLAVRLGLELLVVFIGVYAAALLAQHHERRAELDRAHALRSALASEIAYILEKGRDLDMSQVSVYADAIAGGAQPPLQPIASRMPFSPDVWEAALASGGVQLLEPELLIGLATFYGEMRGFQSELETQRAYARTLLIPNLEQPPSAFYTDAGQLRPTYRWYYEHLRWLPGEVDRLLQRADSLHVVLTGAPRPGG